MKKYIGILLAALLAACAFSLLPDAEDVKETFSPSWELISATTTATVYNAVPAQCNEDCLHTASMFTIVPENISSDRILAMERTMMAEFGLRYGDVVLIEGAGSYDGLWQIQDTMNKRFAGQHKIDFLVPDNIRHGKWKNVKVYKQTNKEFYAYGF
jgi:hypothetical protein